MDAKDRENGCKPRTIACLLNCVDGADKWEEAERAVAICSPDDTWNDDIGRLAAVCKLLGEKPPKWLRGDK